MTYKGKLTKAKKDKVKTTGECYFCGKKTKNLSVDHLVPLSRGGTDDPTNLVAACHHCNQLKGNKTPKEFTPYAK